eukprot:5124727-Pyramimonas_sp.AAC.1
MAKKTKQVSSSPATPKHETSDTCDGEDPGNDNVRRWKNYARLLGKLNAAMLHRRQEKCCYSVRFSVLRL